MRERQATRGRARLPILATKLHIPQLRPSLVPRQRLMDRLAEASARPLTLISAQAGFGKTTLVSEWIHQAGALPVAWLSLDEDDNDPGRFLTYFISALDTLWPGLGVASLSILELPQQPPSKTVVTVLLNSLAGLDEDFYIVLDDYHVVTSPSVHALLAYMLDHQPARMHLIILSRADPPLPLALLRARGQLLELRAADLRFTADEAAAFLNQTMKLGLRPVDVATLEAETEGWVAGLQLAALCLLSPGTEGHDNPSDFIAAFSGSNRFILDYLVEEVLVRQPAPIQEFLLHTSILDQLCGPLCDAVMGDTAGEQRAQSLLEAMERANLFTIPLDQERRWYRYHHLFVGFLRNRLQQTEPELLSELHSRAANWYEQNGLPYEAIGHALDGGDWQAAARLIEATAEDAFMRSQVVTLLNWLEALPADVLAQHPRLSVFYAWALLFAGRFPDVERQLTEAEQTMSLLPANRTGERETWQAQLVLARALNALYSGVDMEHTIDLARQAARSLSPVDPFLRGLAVWVAGIAAYMSGDMASAREAFDESIEISQAAGNSLMTQMSVWMAGYQQMLEGHLHRAEEIFTHGLRLALSTGGAEPPPIACVVYQALGELRREQNDLDGAERHLAQAVHLGEQLRSPEIVIDGMISRARLRQARGDPDGANRALEPALQYVQEGKVSTWTVRQVIAHRARLAVAQGDLAHARAWAQDLEHRRRDMPDPHGVVAMMIDGLEYTTLARLWIAEGRYAEAIRILQTLLDSATSPDWTSITIEALAIMAVALQGLGDDDRALRNLRTSLSLGAPEGYARIYLDEGVQMAILLRKLHERGRSLREPGNDRLQKYVESLLLAFANSHDPAAVMHDMASAVPGTAHSGTSSSLPYFEPLTPREHEVLALLAAGLSNREIASRLIITIGTVKRHVNSIYGKLGASTRAEAVAHARDLGLLA